MNSININTPTLIIPVSSISQPEELFKFLKLAPVTVNFPIKEQEEELVTIQSRLPTMEHVYDKLADLCTDELDALKQRQDLGYSITTKSNIYSALLHVFENKVNYNDKRRVYNVAIKYGLTGSTLLGLIGLCVITEDLSLLKTWENAGCVNLRTVNKDIYTSIKNTAKQEFINVEGYGNISSAVHNLNNKTLIFDLIMKIYKKTGVIVNTSQLYTLAYNYMQEAPW